MAVSAKDIAKQKARDIRASQNAGRGVTTYANGSAPWETNPDAWDVGPNAEGGLAATKKNWLLDKGVPLGVGAIFGYGAFGPGGYASFGAGGGAGGGGGAAASTGLNADGTLAATMGAPAGLSVGPAAVKGGSMASLAALGKYGIPAVGDFLTSAFGTSRDSAEAQKQRDWLAQQAALDRTQKTNLQNQQVALDESKLDPWRGTMSQVGDASRLDRVANANYTPVSVSRGAGGRINTSGGTTYNKSPELIAAAKAAAALVLSGGGRVPTMTDPNNYGKTGTTDLTAGGTTSGPRDPRLRTPGQYLGPADDPWSDPTQYRM